MNSQITYSKHPTDLMTIQEPQKPAIHSPKLIKLILMLLNCEKGRTGRYVYTHLNFSTDRPFHNLGASESGDQQILRISET